MGDRTDGTRTDGAEHLVQSDDIAIPAPDLTPNPMSKSTSSSASSASPSKDLPQYTSGSAMPAGSSTPTLLKRRAAGEDHVGSSITAAANLEVTVLTKRLQDAEHSLERERRKWFDNNGQMREHLARLQTENAQLAQQLSDARAGIFARKKKRAAAEAAAAAAAASAAGVDMDSSFSAAQQATQLLQAVVGPMEEEIAALKSAMATANDNSMLAALEQSHTESIGALEAKVKAAENARADATLQVEVLRTQVSVLSGDLDAAQAALAEEQTAKAELQVTWQRANESFMDVQVSLTTRCQELEDKLEEQLRRSARSNTATAGLVSADSVAAERTDTKDTADGSRVFSSAVLRPKDIGKQVTNAIPGDTDNARKRLNSIDGDVIKEASTVSPDAAIEGGEEAGIATPPQHFSSTALGEDDSATSLSADASSVALRAAQVARLQQALDAEKRDSAQRVLALDAATQRLQEHYQRELSRAKDVLERERASGSEAARAQNVQLRAYEERVRDLEEALGSPCEACTQHEAEITTMQRSVEES
eukprot:UC1_evm1s70